jgi:hypothetical protein
MNWYSRLDLDLRQRRDGERFDIIGKYLVFETNAKQPVYVEIDPGIRIDATKVGAIMLRTFSWIKVYNTPQEAHLTIYSFHCGVKPDLVSYRMRRVSQNLNSLLEGV